MEDLDATGTMKRMNSFTAKRYFVKLNGAVHTHVHNCYSPAVHAVHAAHIRHKEVNFFFVYGYCSIQTYVPDSARVLASVCYEGFSDVVLQGNSSS